MTMNSYEDPTSWRRIVAQTLPYLTMLVFVELASVGTFSGGMWGGVGIGLGILLFLCTAWLDRRWPTPSRNFLYLALLSLTIIALLNLRSTNTAQSWYDWKRLLTIFVPLVLLSSPQILPRADHKHLFNALALAAFVGALALGIELTLDAPMLHMSKGDQAGLTRYNRGLSYLVVLALPIMAALWTRPLPETEKKWMIGKISFQLSTDRVVPYLIFIIVMLFATGLTESRAAKLAFIVAILTVIIGRIAPRFTYRGLLASIVVLLSWPFVVQKSFVLFQDRLAHLPNSWRARVEIWDYMSYRITEHPWLGWGLGTSKFLDFKNPHGDMYQLIRDFAPHPHNVVTQLWVELGLPGLALGIIFALLSLRQASRLAAPLAPYAMGAWAAALCLSLVAYNFWTDSMFATFALTGFAFALLEKRTSNTQSVQHINTLI